MKKALILGINGQDGSYLADILIEQGYEVHGLVRRSSQPSLWRIQHNLDQIVIHQGDLLDPIGLSQLIDKIIPDEIYNEADQDHVGFSHSTPGYSAAVTYGAVSNLLEMVKAYPNMKLFQPLSATMFGNTPGPQNEESQFDPQSPYAVAKTAVYYLCKHYREKHKVFVSTAILYNHDSVRRQGDYLLHKVCKAALAASTGRVNTHKVGWMQQVDIGDAKEYMQACQRLMQLEKPENLVIGSGIGMPVESIIRYAYDVVLACDLNFITTYENTPQNNLVADNSKARALIDFNPQIGVFSIVNSLIELYKEQR